MATVPSNGSRAADLGVPAARRHGPTARPAARALLAAGLCGGLALAGTPSRAWAGAGPPDPHAVQPERPTVATHAHTVAPGWVEVEAGFERDRLASGARAASVPLSTKIGLGGHVQLNLGTPWTQVSSANPAGSGPGDFTAGLKWRLLDGAPLLGDFALLPALKLPTGAASRGTGTGTTDGSLLLISSHDLGPVALDVNAGYARRGGDGSATPRDATLWTVSAGFPLSGVVGGVAEVFGLPGTRGAAGGAPTVGLLLGPTALPRPWFELDAGLIVPLCGPQAHGLYAGCVWSLGRL